MAHTPQKLTDTHIESILHLYYSEGLPPKALALAFPANEEHIRLILRGLMRPRSGFDYSRYGGVAPVGHLATPENIATAQRLKKEGQSYAQISRWMGIDPRVIRAWFRVSPSALRQQRRLEQRGVYFRGR